MSSLNTNVDQLEHKSGHSSTETDSEQEPETEQDPGNEQQPESEADPKN